MTKKTLVALFVTVVLIVLMLNNPFPIEQTDDKTSPNLLSHTVKKQNFDIRLKQTGTLESREKKYYGMPVPRSAKLVWIIEDGAFVDQGDALITFDHTTLLQQLNTKQLDLATEFELLQLDKDNLQLAIAEEASELLKMENKIEASEMERHIYRKFTMANEKNEKESAVNTARIDLDNENESLSNIQSELDAGGLTEEKENNKRKALEKAKNKVENKENALEKAVRDLKIAKKYTYPEELRKKEAAIQEAKTQFDKTQVKYRTKKINLQRKIKNREVKINEAKREYEDLRQDIGKLLVTADESGYISYGGKHNWMQESPEIGREYSQGTQFFSIQSNHDMIAKSSIPEAQRSQLKRGQKTVMRVPAVHGSSLKGEVEQVAHSGKRLMHWDKGSPMLFEFKSSVNGDLSQIVPGMSVEIEINLGTVEEALTAPLECFYEKEGQYYCRVIKGSEWEERTVDLGKMNQSVVEIIAGLDEGDQILLEDPNQNAS